MVIWRTVWRGAAGRRAHALYCYSRSTLRCAPYFLRFADFTYAAHTENARAEGRERPRKAASGRGRP
eukprot:2455144-Prymnesium_polylepis.1